MQIKHRIDEFLYAIFPSLNGEKDQLAIILEKYYTYGPFKPSVMQTALNHFKEMPPAKIKEIAIEIAMKGTEGFNPNWNDYSIDSIPGKQFSDYQILAWYNVSWSLAMPEMVGQLD